MSKTRRGTKTLIERAALTLFIEKGYRGTSIRDITRAAGITEGALYRHFVSKAQLAEALFQKNYETFSATLSGLASGPGPFAGRLDAMVMYFCRSFDADPTLYGYLLLSQHDELRKIDPAGRTPHEILRTAIARAVRRREIRPVDPPLGAAFVMGLVLETAKFVVYHRLAATKMVARHPVLARACRCVLGVALDARA